MPLEERGFEEAADRVVDREDRGLVLVVHLEVDLEDLGFEDTFEKVPMLVCLEVPLDDLGCS